MKSEQHPVHFDDKRWPSVSLLDLRSRDARRIRPFGSIEWAPQGGEDSDNWRMAQRFIEIRDAERAMARSDKRAWLGLGPRQYAYRLKARGFVFNAATKNFPAGAEFGKDHFERAGNNLGLMRRAGLIDWDDVADGRGIEHVPVEFRDNSERIETLAEIVRKQMRHIQLEGQKIAPELWVETEGLYNLIYDLADRYGAESHGVQGQSSITARRKLAERVARRWRRGKVRTRILCVADYDIHGDHILAAIAADTAQHLRDMGLPVDQEQILQVHRVALTEQQIVEHKIPIVKKDGRDVQEAEALPTDELRREVEAALKATLNMTLFDRVAKKKKTEIDALVQKIRRLR
jgi:hypothetical protein